MNILKLININTYGMWFIEDRSIYSMYVCILNIHITYIEYMVILIVYNIVVAF